MSATEGTRWVFSARERGAQINLAQNALNLEELHRRLRTAPVADRILVQQEIADGQSIASGAANNVRRRVPERRVQRTTALQPVEQVAARPGDKGRGFTPGGSAPV